MHKNIKILQEGKFSIFIQSLSRGFADHCKRNTTLLIFRAVAQVR